MSSQTWSSVNDVESSWSANLTSDSCAYLLRDSVLFEEHQPTLKSTTATLNLHRHSIHHGRSEPLPFSDASVVRESDLYLARLAWPDKANSLGARFPKRCGVDVRCNLVAKILSSLWHRPKTRTNSRSSIRLEHFR